MNVRHWGAGLVLSLAATVAGQTAQAQQTANAGPSVSALTVDSGTAVRIEMKQEVTSTKNSVGDTVTAMVTRDVTNHDGRVVFPAGSEARVVVSALQPPMPNRDDARILLHLVSASAGGTNYSLTSSRLMSVKAPIISQRIAGSKQPIEYAVPEGADIEFHLGAPVTVQ